MLYARTFQKLPGRFRNLPEPSGTFLVGPPESCIYGMSCIIFIAFRNITTFPQRRFRKVPEGSGMFIAFHIHSMLFYCILTYPQRMPTLHIFHMNTHFNVVPPKNVPEGSGHLHSFIPHIHCIPHIPHKNLYFVTMTLFLTYIFLCRLVLLLSLRS